MVIAIIGILAAVAIPAFQHVRLETIKHAMERGEYVTPDQSKWYFENGGKYVQVISTQKAAAEETSTKYANLATFNVNGKKYVLIEDITYDRIYLDGTYWKLVPIK